MTIFLVAFPFLATLAILSPATYFKFLCWLLFAAIVWNIISSL
jgi:hypothetical protein